MPNLLSQVKTIFILTTLSCAAFAQAPTPTSVPAPSAQVDAPAGSVVGTVTTQGRTFLGIPYAQPPIGALRWRAPQPTVPWTTLLIAQAAGSACLQPADLLTGQGTANTPLTGSENCLFLNVYTPSIQKTALPVMVWFHGGAFTNGSGVEFDTSHLAQAGNVITVSVNYRLGALGFYAHPGLTAEEPNGGSGNFGIMDQQLAMKWVKDNAAAFGGDPNNITIFGESAGGYSVCEHLVSPSAKGHFDKAIIESGVCAGAVGKVSLAQAEAGGAAFATSLGCTGDDATVLACLRAKAPEDIARTASTRPGNEGPNTWGPVYGDAIVPLDMMIAVTTGAFNQVPVINGTNHDEGRFFAWSYAQSTASAESTDQYSAQVTAFFADKATKVLAEYPAVSYDSPASAYAAVVTDSQFSCPTYAFNTALSLHTPVYQYEFSDPNAINVLQPAPGINGLGAFHSSEIAYVMQTKSAVADPAAFTAAQLALSNRMMGNWITFAQTGNPVATAADAVPWAPLKISDFSIQNFTPAGASTTSSYLLDHHCAFWATML